MIFIQIHLEVCGSLEVEMSLLLVGNEIIHIFYFSGTFSVSEYLFSAPRGLFILDVLCPLSSICSAPSRALYFGCTFSAFEYLFSAPRGLFILDVLSPLLSICSAPSRTLYFGCTFPASEYLFSVPRGLFAQLVNTTVVLAQRV